MKKFLCILRSEQGECNEPSPAEMQAAMDAFKQWSEQFKENIVDFGGKLGDGGVWTSQGVTDGPYAESKEIAGGYMMIAATDFKQATEVVQTCPFIANSGASVEIREIHNL